MQNIAIPKRYQLPYLVFKYLFSISTFPSGKNIAGMCILCGKTISNTAENLYDVADRLRIQLTPDACLCNITGNDVDDDTDLIRYIERIETSLFETQL